MVGLLSEVGGKRVWSNIYININMFLGLKGQMHPRIPKMTPVFLVRFISGPVVGGGVKKFSLTVNSGTTPKQVCTFAPVCKKCLIITGHCFSRGPRGCTHARVCVWGGGESENLGSAPHRHTSVPVSSPEAACGHSKTSRVS